MKLTCKKYGRLQGRDLCEFILENDHGLAVKVLNYGATLEDVAVPVDGTMRHVILSLKAAADYSKERNFLGGTVGRIAGRVWRGQWKSGDRILQLPINDGENHIHGGFGIDQEVWSFRPEQGEDFVAVHFGHLDLDGHNGFPGNLQLEATYALNNSGELTYDLTAYSDKLTVFNPTNHVYFCLDGLDHPFILNGRKTAAEISASDRDLHGKQLWQGQAAGQGSAAVWRLDFGGAKRARVWQ